MTSDPQEMVERLKAELAEMANVASVPMELWDRFSNRVLGAALLIERLVGERDEEHKLLKDPRAVHLNMRRGGIAKLSPAQIGHLYGSDEAREIIAELIRQNPEARALAAEGGGVKSYSSSSATEHTSPDGLTDTQHSAGQPQPIGTAPRDETSILASSTGAVWFQCAWDDEEQRFVTFNRYLESDFRVMVDRTWAPRFWMPIPATPAPADAEGHIRSAKAEP